MSIPEVYITSAIKQIPFVSASIRTQLTQFLDLKVRVPRKGRRTAELKVNIQSPELTPLYSGIGFQPYMNFLYVKWRGHVVFWGPIVTKESDFEDSSLKLNAMDQSARLEHHYFRIGDDALNNSDDSTKGTIPLNWDGLELCIEAGRAPIPGIPLGIRMGSNSHDFMGAYVDIERSQEVWRTMIDMGENTSGPLFDIRPLTVSDSDFAVLDVYGQFRDDLSDDVKLHYRTGLNNIRNLKPTEGGQLVTMVHTVTRDNHWRATTSSSSSMSKYGIWIQWEQVDFNLRDSTTEEDAIEILGGVGDAILDAYGRPLKSLEITLRRDDEVDAVDQFHWLTDFNVSDIVEIQGSRGGEFVDGNYQIDEMRLEQEDASGQVRQTMDVIPWVVAGQYTYRHGAEFVEAEVDDS